MSFDHHASESEKIKVPQTQEPFHLSKSKIQQLYIQEFILDRLSTLMINIKWYCSLLIMEQQDSIQILDHIKPIILKQIQAISKDTDDIKLLKQLQQSHNAKDKIEQYHTFQNLDKFEQYIRILKIQKQNNLKLIETNKNKKITNSKINIIIQSLWKQMAIIIEQDTFTIQRLQSYDVYSYNLTNKEDSIQRIDLPQDHFIIQKINCKMDYLPSVYSWVSPPLHKIYVSESAIVYNKIVPIKIKFIMPNNPQGPIINTTNYFNDNIEQQKAILCLPKLKSKILQIYRIEDISNISTMQKQYIKQIQLPIKWQFSPDTKLIVTPNGQIFGINCRTNKERIDPSLYEITQDKVTNKGQILMPKRQSGFIYLDGSLYIIGGKGVNQPCSRRNFRYKIKQKKWEEIAQSNIALRKPTLCIFNQKFIFKFGGLNEFDYISRTIEMYDPQTDTWAIVRAAPKSALEEIQVLEDSLGVQINQDQIYIFGGKNNNRFSTDTGFILHLTQIRQRKKRVPKVAGDFWNVSVSKRNILSYFGLFGQTNVVTYGNCIYCLRKQICDTFP